MLYKYKLEKCRWGVRFRSNHRSPQYSIHNIAYLLQYMLAVNCNIISKYIIFLTFIINNYI